MIGKLFRRDKTTPNEDNFRVLTVGIVCAIGILIASPFLTSFKETRTYRDLVRLTPFYNVELYYSEVVDDGNAIVFGGTLTKRRCTFDNLVGYVTGQFGQRHRVPVDSTGEKYQGSRANSDKPEAWGPWVIDVTEIDTFGRDLEPQNFEVVAFHIECPSEPTEQNNLFLTAPWGDYEIELDDAAPLAKDEPIIIEKDE